MQELFRIKAERCSENVISSLIEQQSEIRYNEALGKID